MGWSLDFIAPIFRVYYEHGMANYMGHMMKNQWKSDTYEYYLDMDRIMASDKAH